MARSKSLLPKEWSIADLLKHFGGIAPERIRLDPQPGKATERHVTELNDHEDRLYELVDGVLVEKVMGLPESIIGSTIGRLLGNFVEEHDLGVIAGSDGTVRLMPGLVRIPDVAFISWEQLPGNTIPAEAIPDLAPALAIEVAAFFLFVGGWLWLFHERQPGGHAESGPKPGIVRVGQVSGGRFGPWVACKVAN